MLYIKFIILFNSKFYFHSSGIFDIPEQSLKQSVKNLASGQYVNKSSGIKDSFLHRSKQLSKLVAFVQLHKSLLGIKFREEHPKKQLE